MYKSTENDDTFNSVKKAVSKTNEEFANAMARGDAEGVAKCYTEDAEFMAGGAPSV